MFETQTQLAAVHWISQGRDLGAVDLVLEFLIESLEDRERLVRFGISAVKMGCI